MIWIPVLLLVLVLVTVTCDFTPYTLSDDDVALLYSDATSDTDNDTAAIFGDSTVTGIVNDADLCDVAAKEQAEELLNQIYNGGK